jgi:pyridoxal phosphate enzyme (YggS family)
MTTACAALVASNLEQVRARIRAAGGDDVQIVAVTKGFGSDAVSAAREVGLTDLGENYADELIAKWQPDMRWHFLGTVQRNKVRALAEKVDVWQGVDREAAGREIAKRAPGAAVLVQVNLAGDPRRNGCTFAEAPGLVDTLLGLHLDVRGVMGVAPAGPPESARSSFRRLAGLAASLKLSEVSMGMTADLEIAVQEGATSVRLGTALFGPRPEPRPVRRLVSRGEAASG